MKQRGLTLDEWIALGRASGAISDTLTVIWLYCMDEREALRWITAIVAGTLDERIALMRIRGSQQSHAMHARIDWGDAHPSPAAVPQAAPSHTVLM